MLRYQLLGPILLVGHLLPLGCSDGTDSPAYAQAQSGAGAWCKAACSYTSRCANPVVSTCVTSCLSGNADYFSHVSDDYLTKVAPCISNATCTDWDTMSQNCYRATAPTLVPSAAVIDFCKAMSAKFFECFFADDDLTFCAGDFAPWNDSGVNRAKTCVSVDCASLNSCLNDAFNGT